jgi:hypothetical protein
LYYSPKEKPSEELRLIPYHDVYLRRDLVRTAVLRVVDKGADVDQEIDCLRDHVHYYELGKKDRDIFRQAWRCLRKIVRGWSSVTEEDEAAFRAGHLVPFGLVSRIEAARSANLAG